MRAEESRRGLCCFVVSTARPFASLRVTATTDAPNRYTPQVTRYAGPTPKSSPERARQVGNRPAVPPFQDLCIEVVFSIPPGRWSGADAFEPFGLNGLASLPEMLDCEVGLGDTSKRSRYLNNSGRGDRQPDIKGRFEDSATTSPKDNLVAAVIADDLSVLCG